MKHDATRCFEVCGVPKSGGEPLMLRRFVSEDDAIKHALSRDMKVWDDVFVRPGNAVVKVEVVGPPPFPWNVEWVGGNAYVIDANGKKIASLLGTQKQREFVAGILCDLR